VDIVRTDFKDFPPDKAGNDVILVVLDRLSKEPVSILCKKTCTAKELAQLFLEYIFRHYSFPRSIVSDRGSVFISAFWKEFCNILCINMKLSTACKASTDGQTEIVNQYIDQRLRPIVNKYQNNWNEL
jgi:hypothetical protein